jgi:hypothetical protein
MNVSEIRPLSVYLSHGGEAREVKGVSMTVSGSLSVSDKFSRKHSVASCKTGSSGGMPIGISLRGRSASSTPYLTIYVPSWGRTTFRKTMIGIRARISLIEGLLSQGSVQTATYAAFECRSTIEAICYDRFAVASSHLALADLRKQQPRDVIKQVIEEANAKAAAQFTLSIAKLFFLLV